MAPDPISSSESSRSYGGRPRLSRAEQRFNYALAVATVAVVIVLIVASPKVTIGGREIPVLVFALLLGAFLFGLGQMIIGITRRRRYLRSLGAPGRGESE